MSGEDEQHNGEGPLQQQAALQPAAAGPGPSSYALPPDMAEAQAAHQAAMTQYMAAQAQAEQLRRLWADMKAECEAHSEVQAAFKTQQLPLARIKKIMKSDEDVRMVSAEAPVFFAKACECFILELTMKAWGVAQERNRRTVMRSDLAAAISRTDVMDFLLDIVPREEGDAGARGAVPPALPHPMATMYPSLPPPYLPPGGVLPPPPGGADAAAAAAAAAAAVQAGQQQGQPPAMAMMPPPPGMYPPPGWWPPPPGMPLLQPGQLPPGFLPPGVQAQQGGSGQLEPGQPQQLQQQQPQQQ